MEKLYAAAENLQADVVNICRNYTTNDGTISTDKKILKEYIVSEIDKTTLESNELAERVNNFANGKIAWSPWSQFIRRNFLLNHELKFPEMSLSDDFVFAFFILCLAKNFVLFSEAVYVYRMHGESTFHQRRNVQGMVHSRFGDFFIGMEAFEKFMSKFELFRNQPEYKYMVFDLFAKNCSLEPVGLNLYSQFTPAQLDGLIRAELESVEDTTALTAYIFSRMSIFNAHLIRQIQLIQNQQAQIQQLQAQIQKSPAN